MQGSADLRTFRVRCSTIVWLTGGVRRSRHRSQTSLTTSRPRTRCWLRLMTPQKRSMSASECVLGFRVMCPSCTENRSVVQKHPWINRVSAHATLLGCTL
jgi:hypothetical protein